MCIRNDRFEGQWALNGPNDVRAVRARPDDKGGQRRRGAPSE